jgi:hypothetical protein
MLEVFTDDMDLLVRTLFTCFNIYDSGISQFAEWYGGQYLFLNLKCGIIRKRYPLY